MRVSVFSWAELKVTQKNGAVGRALEGKVGGGRCLSGQESVRGRVPVRGPHRNSSGRKEGCCLLLFSMEGMCS